MWRGEQLGDTGDAVGGQADGRSVRSGGPRVDGWWVLAQWPLIPGLVTKCPDCQHPQHLMLLLVGTSSDQQRSGGKVPDTKPRSGGSLGSQMSQSLTPEGLPGPWSSSLSSPLSSPIPRPILTSLEKTRAQRG